MLYSSEFGLPSTKVDKSGGSNEGQKPTPTPVLPPIKKEEDIFTRSRRSKSGKKGQKSSRQVGPLNLNRRQPGMPAINCYKANSTGVRSTLDPAMRQLIGTSRRQSFLADRNVRVLPNIGEMDVPPGTPSPLSRQEQLLEHWVRHQDAVAAQRAEQLALSMESRMTSSDHAFRPPVRNKSIAVSTLDVDKQRRCRRRSSLVIELGVFIAKVITKFLHETSRVGVESNIQLLTLLTQQAMLKSVEEQWEMSNPLSIGANVRRMLQDSETMHVIAQFGYNVQEWPTDPSDLHPAIADYSTSLNAEGKLEDSLTTISSSDIGLQGNTIDEFDLGTWGVEELETHGMNFGLKREPSDDTDITIKATQNKQNIISRLRARAKVMAGNMKKLPKIQSRVTRIYLSSNYSDLREEHNGIWATAVPKMRRIARQNSLHFQLVDLRWGTGEEGAGSDPDDYEIAAQQIKRCYENSTGPFFVVMLSNKYGREFLPKTLSVKKFEAFKTFRFHAPLKSFDLIDEWYKRDDNAVPPVYTLLPIRSKIANYGDMSPGRYNLQQRTAAVRQWVSTAGKLQEAINQLTKAASETEVEYLKTTLEDTFSMSFRANDVFAVTEREIHLSISLQAQFCICYARYIEEIEKHKDEDSARRYVDIVDIDGMRRINERKQDRLELLKISLENFKFLLTHQNPGVRDDQEQKLNFEMEIIQSANLFKMDWLLALRKAGLVFDNPLYLQQYNIEWEKIGEDASAMAENRAYVTAATDAYVSMLTADCIHDVFELVTAYFDNKVRKSVFVDELEEEIIHHATTCNNKMAVYVESASQMEAIDEKLLFCERQQLPLIIYGNSGCGKSSLIAALATHIKTQFGNECIIILRFIGITRLSSTLANLLQSISLQIASAYDLPKLRPLDDYKTCKDYFTDTFAAVGPYLREDKQLFIFLDGLDNLEPDDDAFCMNWLPRRLQPFCQVITSVSVEKKPAWVNIFSAYTTRKCCYSMLTMDDDAWKEILRSTLKRKQRQLTTPQLMFLWGKVEENCSPMYLKLLLDEAIKWPSYLAVEDIVVANTIAAALDVKLFKLELILGRTFVRHAIAYLSVTHLGLTDLEWEDALACDDQVLTEVFEFVDPPNTKIIRCPMIYTARLVFYLGDMLSEKEENGILVYHWSHQTIRNAIEKIFLKSKSQEYSHIYYSCNRVLADLFFANGAIEKSFALPQKRIFIEKAYRLTQYRPLSHLNVRKLRLLPLVLYNSGAEDSIREEYKRKIICNITWLLTKLKGCSYREVLADFNLIMEKDDEILLIEDIFLEASETLRRKPDLLQLELLARFSRIPHSNADCIDLMVLQSRSLLIFYPDIFLYPVYPCVPPADLSLRMAKRGPSHLIGVYAGKLAIVWDITNGLQVWETLPVFKALIHASDFVLRENLMFARNYSIGVGIRDAILFVKSVATGELINFVDILSLLKRGRKGTEGTELNQLFTPLAVNDDCTRIVLRINSNHMLIDQSGLLFVDCEKMTIIGTIGKNIYGRNVIEACILDEKIVLMCKEKLFSGKKSSGSRTIIIFGCPPFFQELQRITFPGGDFVHIPIEYYGDIEERFVECHPDKLESLHIDHSDNHLDVNLLQNLKSVKRKVVAIKITDRKLVVVLFSYTVQDGISVLLTVTTAGVERGKAVSMEGRANCLSLSMDQSSAFVGYKTFGTIEVYYLPEVTLMHTYRPHQGDVNSIYEISPWKILSTGSDKYARMFDLGRVIPMNFTRRQSFELDPKNFLAAAESVYNLYSNNVVSLDIGHTDATWNKLVLCNESSMPLLVDIFNGFTALQLLTPYKIESVHKVMFASDDKKIIGLGFIKGERRTHRSSYQFLTWSTSRLMIVDHTDLVAHTFGLSRDRHSLALLRYHGNGSHMIVFRLKDNDAVVKFNSRRVPRTIYDRVLLSDNNRFVVTVEAQSTVIVWRMRKCSKAGKGAGDEYMADDVPFDDEPGDDDVYFDEKIREHFMTTRSKSSVKSDVKSTTPALLDTTDSSVEAKSLIPNSTKSNFVIKVSALPDAVIMANNNYLFAGSITGRIFLFELDFLIDVRDVLKISSEQNQKFLIENIKSGGKGRKDKFCMSAYKHSGAVTCACLSSTGQFFVSGSTDTIVKVWDLETCRIQATLRGHTEKILSVAVGNFDHFVISGSADMTIRVWNMSSGRCLTTFNARADIYSVVMLRRKGNLAYIAALADQRKRKKLMLFKSFNLITTNASENF